MVPQAKKATVDTNSSLTLCSNKCSTVRLFTVIILNFIRTVNLLNVSNFANQRFMAIGK